MSGIKWKKIHRPPTVVRMREQVAASQHGPTVPLRQRLRDALTTAIKSRDRVAVAALRSTLAAIDNAEAVDRPPSMDRGLAIESIPARAGATEIARRILTPTQVEWIVRTEMAERHVAADAYEQAGQRERAERLREEIGVIWRCVEGATP